MFAFRSDLLYRHYRTGYGQTLRVNLTDAIVACDSVINSGLYAIEPRSSYLQMVYPNNGPQIREFIFAIPYDPAAAALPDTNSNMYHGRYDLPRSERQKFGLPFTPSAPAVRYPNFTSTSTMPTTFEIANGSPGCHS